MEPETFTFKGRTFVEDDGHILTLEITYQQLKKVKWKTDEDKTSFHSCFEWLDEESPEVEMEEDDSQEDKDKTRYRRDFPPTTSQEVLGQGKCGEWKYGDYFGQVFTDEEQIEFYSSLVWEGISVESFKQLEEFGRWIGGDRL